MLAIILSATTLSLSAGWWGSDKSSQSQQNSQAIEITDRELQKKVNDILNGGWFSTEYPRTQATVSNGIVTLEGTVESMDAKQSLYEKVADIAGVRGVRNNVTIENGRRYQNRNDQQQTQMSDRELQRKVNRFLNSGWFSTKYPHVGATVTEGAVQLNGEVQTLKQKNEITREIQKISGVHMVENNIEVRASNSVSGSKENLSDHDIQMRVNDTLKGGFFFSGYNRVKSDVNQGVVTLRGEVESLKAKQDLTNKIKQIPGVKKINDNIEINANLR